MWVPSLSLSLLLSSLRFQREYQTRQWYLRPHFRRCHRRGVMGVFEDVNSSVVHSRPRCTPIRAAGVNEDGTLIKAFRGMYFPSFYILMDSPAVLLLDLEFLKIINNLSVLMNRKVKTRWFKFWTKNKRCFKCTRNRQPKPTYHYWNSVLNI